MQPVRVGIVGASGYSGVVATRIVAAHPRLSLAWCTSDRWVGEEVAARTGARVERRLRFVPNAHAVGADGASDAMLGAGGGSDVDVVMLATSAEVSLGIAPQLIARGVPVVDLSGAFRLADASAYPRWYRFEHSATPLLREACYGLPELFGRAAGRLVANPGCYATAALLALGPLVRDGLVELDGLIVDGKSGVTGAGRQATEAYSFVEIDSDLRAYKVLAHQHTPEIAQGLGRLAGTGVRVTFTPHLIPVRRGLLTTCYARPRAGTTSVQIEASLRAAYDDGGFVRVAAAPEQVTLASVVGTNDCLVGARADDDVVIVVAALDNLLKGAAGQAVQNLNAMFGLEDGAGLDNLHRSAP